MAGVIASVAFLGRCAGAAAAEPAAIWMTLGPGTVALELALEPVSSLAPHALDREDHGGGDRCEATGAAHVSAAVARRRSCG